MKEREIILEKKWSHYAKIQVGLRFRESRECFGGEKTSFYRERMREMKSEIALKLFKENTSRWIKDLSKICWALFICRGANENLSTAKMPQWIEELSRSYRPDKNLINGLRIYREAIETNSKEFWWIEDALISFEKRSPRGLIDSYLLRSVKKLSSLIKTGFSKRGKTQIWMQSSKSYSTKYPNNILSSQKHLSRKKCKAYKIQNTHTHTK